MKIEMWSIDRPIAYVRNARKIPQQAIDKVAGSLNEFGWRQPIVVDTKEIIIVGHTRLKAAQKLGLKEVPVHIAENLTEAQVKAYRLADNRTGEETDWDQELLSLEIKDLTDYDINLDLTGFGDKEVTQLLNQYLETEQGNIGDDEIPDKIEARTKPGDLWQLGKHKLLCGDATIKEDVAKLMGDMKIDMIFTDPPYNVNYSGRGKNELGTIKNDNMDNDSFMLFLNDTFSLAHEYLKPLGSLYVCHGDSKSDAKISFEVIFDKYFKKSSTIIWVKQSAGMGWQDYRCQHEPILYGWKEGKGKHSFYGDRTKSTVWNISRDSQSSYKHPTQKPIALIEEAIRNSSKEEDLVYDSFGGSGSTLIAAEKNNRICNTIELDPKFCDVILQRWEDFTGDKAKLNGRNKKGQTDKIQQDSN
jgi:DNA modification methylase